MKRKLISTILLAALLATHCAKSDEAGYDCVQNSGLIFDGITNYRDVNCSGIPNEIQIRMSAVTVPPAGQLILRAFSSSNDNGFYIEITPNQIKTAAANGSSGAATFSSGVDFTSSKNVCFEIHDITKEKHILAVYPSADCLGSPVINSANELVTFGENRVRYAGTTGVSVGELYLKKTEAHGH